MMEVVNNGNWIANVSERNLLPKNIKLHKGAIY